MATPTANEDTCNELLLLPCANADTLGMAPLRVEWYKDSYYYVNLPGRLQPLSTGRPTRQRLHSPSSKFASTCMDHRALARLTRRCNLLKSCVIFNFFCFAPKCRFHCLNQVDQPMSSPREAAMKFRLPRKLAVTADEVLRAAIGWV